MSAATASAEGSAAAQERAAAFVCAHGHALARRRAAALRGRADVAEVLALLGEPDRDAPAADWLPHLAVLGEQRALRAPSVERACAAVARALPELVGEVPQGAALDARLQRAGLLGGYLARSPFVRPAVLDALGDFLATHFAPERLEGFQWDNLLAHAVFFANAPHEAADGILQWCGRELERGFRTRAFDALRTARVLCGCDAHALPGARIEVGELVVALLTEQAPDGSFGPPDAPPAARVEAALAGLAALRFLSR